MPEYLRLVASVSELVKGTTTTTITTTTTTTTTTKNKTPKQNNWVVT